MPKNVMKLLKPSPHRARNDFDLSHRHVFDANFGELLPATCIETVPGDNITLHASDLLRAIPFVASPFLRAKQHLDVWFVPYHDLWHQFDAFITQKSEPVSSAFKGSSYCPWMSQYNLYAGVSSAVGTTTDIVGRNLTDRSYYLLELLGYGDILNAHGTSAGNGSFKVNPFRLAAYNYIWYNEYRQQYYDDGKRGLTSGDSPAMLFNFDDLQCDTAAHAEITNNNQYRLKAMAQMRYRCWKKDLFTGVLPNTQFGLVSTVPTLGGGSVSFSQPLSLSGTTGIDKGSHYIGDRTGTQVNLPDPTGSGAVDAYGNPIFGGVNLANLASAQTDNNGLFSQRVFGLNSKPIDPDYPSNTFVKGVVDPSLSVSETHPFYDYHTHTFNGTISASGTATFSGGSFDILALRKSEAIQIWRENALRAGNHIKDNMMAHYGVASDFNDHRPTYLGSVSAPLNIGDIAATANTSGINNVVGDIAGKGLSSLDEKVFKYHAKDFGVIMVMFSMLPEAEYDAKGIERTNQLLESEDFFVPEYENLGLEAVSVINIYPRGSGSPADNAVFGFAPRYYGYKTKIDKVFGQFVGSGIFRSWSSQRSDVSATLSAQTTYSMPLSLLYVNPAIYDANFNVGISASPQFLVDLYFDVDAIRPMSVVGLPFS